MILDPGLNEHGVHSDQIGNRLALVRDGCIVELILRTCHKLVLSF